MAIPFAILATILLFMDQQITALIVNRKDHKLKVHVCYVHTGTSLKEKVFDYSSLSPVMPFLSSHLPFLPSSSSSTPPPLLPSSLSLYVSFSFFLPSLSLSVPLPLLLCLLCRKGLAITWIFS